MINKKGVSTLIATVLLIGIVIAGVFVVSSGYNALIKKQIDKGNQELVKLNCPSEFDFQINACYIKATNEYGLIHIVLDNRYTSISNKSKILLKGGGKSISLPIWDIGEISAGGAVDADLKYTLAEFQDGIVEKIQLMPLLIDKEKKVEVTCDNFPSFDIEECGEEDKTDRCPEDMTKRGQCSLINPPGFCQTNLRGQLSLIDKCTSGELGKAGCPCPQEKPTCNAQGHCS